MESIVLPLEDQCKLIVKALLSRTANRLPESSVVKGLVRARITRLKEAAGKSKPGRGPEPPSEMQIYTHSLERAAQTWISIHETLCRDAGLDHPLKDEIGWSNCDFYAKLDLADLLIPWIKENSAYASAKGLLQSETNEASCSQVNEQVTASLELLHPWKNGVLGFGWVADRCRWVMLQRPKTSFSFRLHVFQAAQNILYLKRGCPCLEESHVEAALAKHRKCLGTERPALSEKLQARKAKAKDCLKQLIYEVFLKKFDASLFEDKESQDGSWTHLDKLKPCRFYPEETVPSLHAAFGASRADGGAFGELLRIYDAGGKRLYPPFMGKDGICVSQFLEPGKLDRYVEYRPGRIVHVRTRPLEEAQLACFSWMVSHLSLDTQLIYAKPSPVREPCKCRMITMGEAIAYQRCFQLQKFLSRRLAKVPAFTYTGQPISPQEWGKHMRPLRIGEQYVSGDYSAATDNLDPEMSDYAAERICQCVTLANTGDYLLETPWGGLFKAGLTGHLLVYNGDLVPQRWGQLMGSPVSFPVLNLVNAATTASVCGWEPGKSVLGVLESIGCRTNGDDIVFILPANVPYEDWKEAVTSVGLAPSLGKNYLSPHFAIMNSEMRVFIESPASRLERPRPEYAPAALVDPVSPYQYHWEPVGFLNLPILFGLEAKGVDAGRVVLDRIPWFALGELSRALLKWTSEPIQRRRLAGFLGYYTPVRSRLAPGVNLYVPESLGGCGLPNLFDRPIPRENLLRAAYLATLDTKKRLKAIRPPAEDVPNGLESVVRFDESSAKTFTRVRPAETADGEEVRKLFSKVSKSHIPLPGLANCLRRLEAWEDREAMDNILGHSKDVKTRLSKDGSWSSAIVEDDGSCRLQHFDDPVARRATRERVYLHRILRQCEQAKRKSSHPDPAKRISPMEEATLGDWYDRQTLETVTVDRSYRVPVQFAEPCATVRDLSWAAGLGLSTALEFSSYPEPVDPTA